ncbi:hypothetical protein ACOJAK_11815 [Corynebacterium striatum]|uniref:hypothetical protein n=1 Tax=Corynebacterium striatum TaxID=43770 RepID=UPI003B5A949B
MPVVSGSLLFVTSRPSAVSEVWVRARDVRTSVQGVVVESNDRVPVVDGKVSFEVLPGPAVLTLVEAGRPVDTIPIVVGDAPEQSLMDVVDAALIVDESQASVIESLAAQVVADAHAAAASAAEAEDSKASAADFAATAGKAADNAAVSAAAAKSSEEATAGLKSEAADFAATAGKAADNAAGSAEVAKDAQAEAADSAAAAEQSAGAAKAAQARSEEIATSTSWDGDQLTVNGKTSPSLTGPPGPKGDTGSVENVSWDDISDKPATFPPGTHTHTTAQVTGLDAALASKSDKGHTHTTAQVTGLDAALAGKADKGHRHKVEDVDGLKERLDQQDAAAKDVYASLIETKRVLSVKADESYVKSQIASTRSYVDRAVADGSKIKVVSSLPSYPDSSTVYIVV